jgi:CheY-like chemotaxis protein
MNGNFAPQNTQKDRARPVFGPAELRGRETILVVDDETDLLEILAEVLPEYGYHTLIAQDGEKAVDILHASDDGGMNERSQSGKSCGSEKHTTVDLIILDLGMPGMGGHLCLEQINRINPSARVLVASGYMDEPLMQSLFSQGASGFIEKPYDFHELLKRVRQILDAP